MSKSLTFKKFLLETDLNYKKIDKNTVVFDKGNETEAKRLAKKLLPTKQIYFYNPFGFVVASLTPLTREEAESIANAFSVE